MSCLCKDSPADIPMCPGRMEKPSAAFKLPEKVKIGGHWYKVLHPYEFKERYDRYGHTNSGQKEIALSGVDGNGVKRTESSIIVTFIHEVLHGIDSLIDFLPEGAEETTVGRLSEAIYQVLVDNGYLKVEEEA